MPKISLVNFHKFSIGSFSIVLYLDPNPVKIVSVLLTLGTDLSFLIF